MSSDHKIELTSKALRLRPFRLDDAEPICEAVHESINEFLPWLPWCHTEYTIDDTRSFLEGRAQAFENEEEYGFAIVERASGRLVGACGINQIDKPNARANLGYWIRSSATRKGYACQASLVLARWAFEALGMERIEVVVAVGNEASQRVAAKMGARREGVARMRLHVRGVAHDAVVYSLLPSDLPES
jgi:ribosomal-protein-serine acetyltransferase